MRNHQHGFFYPPIHFHWACASFYLWSQDKEWEAQQWWHPPWPPPPPPACNRHLVQCCFERASCHGNDRGAGTEYSAGMTDDCNSLLLPLSSSPPNQQRLEWVVHKAPKTALSRLDLWTRRSSGRRRPPPANGRTWACFRIHRDFQRPAPRPPYDARK